MSSSAPSKPLTVQQDRFAYFIATGYSQEDAAREAGYSPNTARHMAHRTLANVGVQQAVERYRKQVARSDEYTVAQWRDELRGYINDAHAANSHSAVFKGMELLGRHIGALTDTGRVSGEQAAFFASLGAVMQQAFSAQFPQNAGKQDASLPAGQQVIELTS